MNQKRANNSPFLEGMQLATENTIALELTSSCASNCVKCYRRKIWGRGTSMPDAIFERVMEGLLNYSKPCSILLGTGESILEIDKVSRLIEWSNETGNNIRILTTGVPLVPKTVSILSRAKYLSTQITLDGFYPADVEGVQRINLLKVKEKISLASREIKIVINYTLTNKNFDSLADLISFSHENGITTVYVTPIMVYELCEDARRLIPQLSDPKISTAIATSKSLANKLSVNLIIGAGKPAILNNLNELQRHCQKLGLIRPIVRVDGKVSICWGREDVLLGDLQVDSLDKLLMSELLATIRQKHESGTLSQFCSECIVYANSALDVMKIPNREPSFLVGSLLSI